MLHSLQCHFCVIKIRSEADLSDACLCIYACRAAGAESSSFLGSIRSSEWAGLLLPLAKGQIDEVMESHHKKA